MITFWIICYAVCYLVADAHIFGTDATYVMQAPDEEDPSWWPTGILPIRQRLLRYRFFRELFGCYFCMGCWVGPLVHTALRLSPGAPDPAIAHALSPAGWTKGLVLAALLTAPVMLLINLSIGVLEQDG